MAERDVVIGNSLGLHARAAAKLVRLASTFRSSIELIRVDNGLHANAKSILSVLHLAAGRGVTIRLKASGADEERALDAIEALFISGFGEI